MQSGEARGDISLNVSCNAVTKGHEANAFSFFFLAVFSQNQSKYRKYRACFCLLLKWWVRRSSKQLWNTVTLKPFPSYLNPGIPVEDRVNIFINSFGSIQETTMVRTHFIPARLHWESMHLSVKTKTEAAVAFKLFSWRSEHWEMIHHEDRSFHTSLFWWLSCLFS